jgi:hypothetical protein
MFEPIEIRLGHDAEKPHLRLEVLDYVHPDRAEPEGLDLMQCRAGAYAEPVGATFDLTLRLDELFELREYLKEINSGNGPSRSFELAGGLLTLSFAPTRRGPVLCAVLLKRIDASHLRLEYLVTLEPESITRTLSQLSDLEA